MKTFLIMLAMWMYLAFVMFDKTEQPLKAATRVIKTISQAIQPTPPTPASPEPLAGWFGVFPELQGYARSFQSPIISSDKKVYRQMARYEWMGGRYEIIEVTLARDLAFKQRYAMKTLRQQVRPPEEVRVGRRLGWLWNLEGEIEGKLDGIRSRLVLPLSADKILMLEGKGQTSSLPAVAERFDQLRAEAALAAPPRTIFGRTLDAFRVLKKGVSYSEVLAWVGSADRDLGSGIHVLEYGLSDRSRLLLGFADFNSLLYVKHEHKSGKVKDLVK